MTRLVRVAVQNNSHHVTQRDNRRQKTIVWFGLNAMLDHIDRCNTYLSDADKSKDKDLNELHTRTGRPLGCTDLYTSQKSLLEKYWLPKDQTASKFKELSVLSPELPEISTPRWTTYDAAFFGVDLTEVVPATQQKNAYTSPIWYSP